MATAHTAYKQVILLTGASGGLGQALADAYADPGVYLYLWGRNQERLAQVEEHCRNKGAATHIIAQDIRDRDRSAAIVRELFMTLPADLAILGAGVTAGTLPDGHLEPVQDAVRTLDVDSTSTINMAATLIDLMLNRGKGHIACISSVASFFPLPPSPAYSAAKSALAFYMRGMRMRLWESPVRISLIYPGYIDTPMTWRFEGPIPFCWSAPRAARHIRRKLDAGKGTIAFPLQMALGIQALNLLPDALARHVVKLFSYTIEPDKESPAEGQD